jgi:hypothetical protein
LRVCRNAALLSIAALFAGCNGVGHATPLLAGRSSAGERVGAAHRYHTNFPLTENPISEGGRWINGQSAGIDWTNVQTTPRLAFGTMPGDAEYPYQYADSTAVLTGRWGGNQTVQATLSVPNPSGTAGVFEEVELRVRTTIAAHSITGYEINCSVNTNDPYLQVVKWNGPLADFTYLDARSTGCANGDVLKATVTGAGSSTIAVYKNGKQILTVVDSNGPFTSGSPGIGFFLQGATGLNAGYGFREFRAVATRF